MKEKTSYASVYEDMQDILEKPELYDEVITEFSAGGLGGCAMQHKITIAELVRCWSHPEYHTLCHSCGKIAYITKWAGHVNGAVIGRFKPIAHIAERTIIITET